MAEPENMPPLLFLKALTKMRSGKTESAQPDEPVIMPGPDGQPAWVVLSYEKYESLMETLDALADPDEWEAIRQGLEDVRTGNVVSYEEAFGEPQRRPHVRIELTEGETTAMYLLAMGKSVEEVAAAMQTSPSDMERLMTSIKEKLNSLQNQLPDWRVEASLDESVRALVRTLEKHAATEKRQAGKPSE